MILKLGNGKRLDLKLQERANHLEMLSIEQTELQVIQSSLECLIATKQVIFTNS
jgi:hypothetical protein